MECSVFERSTSHINTMSAKRFFFRSDRHHCRYTKIVCVDNGQRVNDKVKEAEGASELELLCC